MKHIVDRLIKGGDTVRFIRVQRIRWMEHVRRKENGKMEKVVMKRQKS